MGFGGRPRLFDLSAEQPVDPAAMFLLPSLAYLRFGAFDAAGFPATIRGQPLSQSDAKVLPVSRYPTPKQPHGVYTNRLNHETLTGIDGSSGGNGQTISGVSRARSGERGGTQGRVRAQGEASRSAQGSLVIRPALTPSPQVSTAKALCTELKRLEENDGGFVVDPRFMFTGRARDAKDWPAHFASHRGVGRWQGAPGLQQATALFAGLFSELDDVGRPLVGVQVRGAPLPLAQGVAKLLAAKHKSQAQRFLDFYKPR